MKEETELKLLAYADGELPAAEVAGIEALLAENQAAADLLAELRWSQAAIVEVGCEVKVPETREFYWSKISRSIEQSERQEERNPTAGRAFVGWRRIFMPLAGLAAIALILNVNQDKPVGESAPGTSGTGVPVAAAPEPVWEDASVYEFYVEKEKMSVIWVTTDGSAELAAPTRDNLFRDDEF